MLPTRSRPRKSFSQRTRGSHNRPGRSVVLTPPPPPPADLPPALCFWKQQEDLIGTPPFERANHTAVLIDSKFYIYGGHDSTGTPLNDVVIYDMDRSCWIPASFHRALPRKAKSHDKHKSHNPFLQSCSQPPPRCKHTAVYYQNQMVVFGGCLCETEGEMYFLEIDSMNWWKYVPQNAPPEALVQRSHHSAVIWGANMVVFGGISGETVLSSLISFDFVKFRWTVLKIELPKVYGHSSFVRGDVMFVIGGWREVEYNFLAVSLIDNSKVSVSNYLPEFEFDLGLSAICYDTEFERLYVMGGYSINADVEEGCTERLHIIDLKQKTMADVFSALIPNCPSPRCGHVMVMYRHSLFMFGGCNRLPLLNGDWVFCDFSNAVWEFRPPPYAFHLPSLREMLQESEGAVPLVHHRRSVSLQ